MAGLEPRRVNLALVGPNGSSRTAHYDASAARRSAISRSEVETSAKTLPQSLAVGCRKSRALGYQGVRSPSSCHIGAPAA